MYFVPYDSIRGKNRVEEESIRRWLNISWYIPIFRYKQ